MNYINEAIHILHNSQARHKRKGFKYGANTESEMLKHAAEELVELAEVAAENRSLGETTHFGVPEKVEQELADLVMILLHFAYVRGISMAWLEVLMFDKLLTRFTLSKKERKQLKNLQADLIDGLNKRNGLVAKKRLFGNED